MARNWAQKLEYHMEKMDYCLQKMAYSIEKLQSLSDTDILDKAVGKLEDLLGQMKEAVDEVEKAANYEPDDDGEEETQVPEKIEAEFETDESVEDVVDRLNPLDDEDEEEETEEEE